MGFFLHSNIFFLNFSRFSKNRNLSEKTGLSFADKFLKNQTEKFQKKSGINHAYNHIMVSFPDKK